MLTSFCLLVAWPRHCELENLEWLLVHQREVVNEKVRTSQDGLYVSARLSALRRVGDRLTERLPDEPRLAEFLQAVDDCVKAEPGVTNEIQRTVGTADGPVATVPIRLRLVGSYEGVYRCLAAIERLERLTRFQHVRVARSEDGKDVVAEAEVHVYYLVPLKETSGCRAAEVRGDTRMNARATDTDTTKAAGRWGGPISWLLAQPRGRWITGAGGASGFS